MSVVSPVDGLPQARREEADTRQSIIAAWILGAIALMLTLLAVVLAVRTPDGTLIVEINEADAVVQVLDNQGKIEITRRSDGETLSISIDPGEYRLKVEKNDFRFFTQDFTIESGGTTKIRARLEPLPAELRPLQRYIGAWEHQVILKPTDGSAERTEMTVEGTWNWILEGRMIEQFVIWSPVKTQGLTLMTYDAGQGEYRQWYFDSNGGMPRGDLGGKWDEATQSFNWKATDKDGNTTEQVHRFSDKDNWE